jgi:hypothetical protein
MGVLNCNRNGCTNVMCDRISQIHGYICNDCFNELVASGPETNIEIFMNTPKRNPINLDAARARFDVEFPER